MGKNIKNTWEIADQHFKTSDSLGAEDELMFKNIYTSNVRHHDKTVFHIQLFSIFFF